MKMKWIQKLRQIDIGISVIALVLLIAVTFAGVIFRYVFSKPFSWQEEVQLALIIWVIFFGARYAFETFSHVAIDMLYELFPAKAQKVLTVLIAVVVTVVLGCIVVFSMKYIQIMFHYNLHTSILHWPYGWIYLPVPISCICMIIQFWENSVAELKTKKEVK